MPVLGAIDEPAVFVDEAFLNGDETLKNFRCDLGAPAVYTPSDRFWSKRYFVIGEVIVKQPQFDGPSERS